jgi:hypothetical protein
MFENQIARGMAALDAEVPGWRERVRCDALDVQSPYRCVLAQVFGSYGAPAALSFRARHDDSACGFAVDFTMLDRRTRYRLTMGGLATSQMRTELYTRLTDEWRTALLAPAPTRREHALAA